MGLDLYHFRAIAERRGHPVLVDDTPGSDLLRAKFGPFLTTVEEEQPDWAASFGAAGLDWDHYTSDSYTREVRTPPEKHIEYHYFKRLPTAPVTAPDRIVFDTSIDPRLHREDAGAIRHPIAAFLAPEASGEQVRTPRFSVHTHLVVEQALYCEEVGYQRKGVRPAFYDEFGPAEFVVDLERVRHMLRLLDPESQRDPDDPYSGGWDFKGSFVDNWDESTSFVLVSW